MQRLLQRLYSSSSSSDTWSPNKKLHAYLLLAQISFAGFEILSRIALTEGTHPLAFTLYRNCIATVLLGIIATLREKKQCPDFKTFICLFGLGFLGVTVNQVCYLIGLKYTSAIFASAMRNSTPVFTFVIAAILRIEKVSWKRRDGQAKVVGALLGLCGSLILSIYRGPVVIESNISITSADKHVATRNEKLYFNLFGKVHLELPAWQIGAVLLAISCVAFGVFLILQSPILDKHSAPISFAAFTCFSSTLQIPILGVIYERNWKNWRLSSSSEALTILYAGAIGSGLVSSIQSWGVLTSGPVTVAAYQPLETLFTALLSLIFLREDLHLGSILGGIIVVSGLYLLIWGQNKERKLDEETGLPISAMISSRQVYPDIPQALQHIRRHSCDLEFTRKHHEASVRRHSSTYIYDLASEMQPQGPLRRLSSTFTNLVRSLEIRNAGHQVIENHQLLPVEIVYSHEIEK